METEVKPGCLAYRIYTAAELDAMEFPERKHIGLCFSMMRKLIRVCESPIEKRFMESWCELAETCSKNDTILDMILNIEPQASIADYRVDFLFKKARIVVELDGHDYHKSKEARTKDASRDRFLTSIGYTVLRFTGTEITRDVAGCVADVEDMIVRKWANDLGVQK